ncbi:LytS/YhcK type 5TM receptor domain-containing protein [Effusibacillus consociatus]|uniref:LytS/YhcK type 5TM receptor domain-containing protein n=1 Tax=Effusibacillus consociatus TaxID=1117041 RepID=A0ABV9Q2H0_9BACL
MTGISNLILNILFILFSIFFYFWISSRLESKWHQKLATAVLSGFTIILCMTFPFFAESGFRLDLRMVPLLIGILYGGYGTGIILTLLLFGYRYYLGGAGVLQTFVLLPPIIILAFYFVKRYPNYDPLNRVLCTLMIAFFGTGGILIANFCKSKLILRMR